LGGSRRRRRRLSLPKRTATAAGRARRAAAAFRSTPPASWATPTRAHTRAVDPLVAASRAAGVRDERVLNAIAAVPRADFVPAAYGRYAAAAAPAPAPHRPGPSAPAAP